MGPVPHRKVWTLYDDNSVEGFEKAILKPDGPGYLSPTSESQYLGEGSATVTWVASELHWALFCGFLGLFQLPCPSG